MLKRLLETPMSSDYLRGSVCVRVAVLMNSFEGSLDVMPMIVILEKFVSNRKENHCNDEIPMVNTRNRFD